MSSTAASEKDSDSAAWRASLRTAIEEADLNVLRMALYQLTGDPALENVRIEKVPIRGGAYLIDTVAADHCASVKALAFSHLENGPITVGTPPSRSETRRLMEIFAGETLSDKQFEFAREELAFSEFPREVNWRTKPSDDELAHFHVVIVGAGISGIAAAVQLARLGIPFTVIERQADVGGTWLQNDYPEVRVDVPSHVYQYKFEKQYPWSELYASGPENQKYLRHVARKYGVMPHIRFGVSLSKAVWQETETRWHLTVAGSTDETIVANVVISANGLFSTPSLPDIPGITTYERPMFHTSAWDRDVTLAGQRIALIGTGSSGAQVMPHLAAIAKKLCVFQRTPNWYSAMEGYRQPITDATQWLFKHVPHYWNWYSYSRLVAALKIQDLQVHDREWQRQGGKISRGNDKLREALTTYLSQKLDHDAELIHKCTPTYAPLARRLVVDSGWFEALKRPNVELIVDGIERISPDGIVTRDGTQREFDVIVLGAGFRVSEYLWPVEYIGRDGVPARTMWEKDGARAHRGMTLPGFPNLFLFYGPNGQPRSGSFHSWAEVWTRYAVSAITTLLETKHKVIECRLDAFQKYNTAMDAEMRNMIWEEEGKSGYYVNKHGRSGVNMPWRVEDYHACMMTPDLTEFDLR